MAKMRAELRQVLGKPAKLNKDGELVSEEYASININVPLDSGTQHKAVSLLQNFLGNPKIFITIEPQQPRISTPIPENEDGDDEDDEDDQVVDAENNEAIPLNFRDAGVTPAPEE